VSNFFFNHKIYDLFPRLRSKIFILIFLSLFSSVLDLLSIGLLAPLVGIVLNKSLINENAMLLAVNSLLNYFSINIFFILPLLIFLCFIIKATITFYIIKFIQSFCLNEQAQLRNRILAFYIKMPFSSFLEKKYDEKFISLTDLIRNVSENTLINYLRLISDSIIFFIIFLFLIFINWQISLFIILVIFFIYFFFKFFLKKKITMLGKSTVSSLKNIYQNSHTVLSTLKEIKIFNKEKFFTEKITIASKSFSESYVNQILLGSLPKLIIEVSMVTSILVILVISMSLNIEFDELLPILTVFTFAAIRLGPITHSILASKSVVWNTFYAVDLIQEQINELKNFNFHENNFKPLELLTFNNKINFKDCFFKFNNNKVIFKNLNFEINKNQIVCLKGISGSGKSTFLSIFMGLLKFDSGEIYLDDKKISLNNFTLVNELSLIPQDIVLLDDTIKNNIVFGSEYNFDAFNKATELANLKDFINGLNLKENSNIGSNGVFISGGQKQKIAIARAIYNKKNFLIFDEPTSALDSLSKAEIIMTIRNLRKYHTILIATHDDEMLKISDIIYKINNYKLEKIEF
jgi:ABC-type multidrug transport system fused ATPase/permease subunit